MHIGSGFRFFLLHEVAASAKGRCGCEVGKAEEGEADADHGGEGGGSASDDDDPTGQADGEVACRQLESLLRCTSHLPPGNGSFRLPHYTSPGSANFRTNGSCIPQTKSLQTPGSPAIRATGYAEIRALVDPLCRHL